MGHKVQKDEFAPRMVDIQGGDRNACPPDCVVAASQTSTWDAATTQSGGHAFRSPP